MPTTSVMSADATDIPLFDYFPTSLSTITEISRPDRPVHYTEAILVILLVLVTTWILVQTCYAAWLYIFVLCDIVVVNVHDQTIEMRTGSAVKNLSCCREQFYY